MAEPELVTIDELRRRGKVIDHNTPGVIAFPQPAKCPNPNCDATFFTNADLSYHRESKKCWSNTEKNSEGWKPFENGSGEWTFKEKVPYLVRACNNFGDNAIGGYKYRLSGEKFIVRVKVNE